ncbi:hypothetical protein GK677_06020 [Bifidobacteriaceae bacterium NR044]|nr:hypothetical protein [Bifidobacteriaceae bacterium NR043]MBF9354303.1 hypothetical protein [Bifidobacteriaceae bacterium NR044]RFT36992.1 hypothetical protein CG398_08270 [Bifidobacteriaceae bacterium NR003]
MVNVLCEFVGHAFGFPDCHPPLFGVAVLDSQDFRLMLFGVGLGFVVLWWFENWIVDASDYVRFFLGFHVFAFTDFRPAPFWWSRLDRFVIV